MDLRNSYRGKTVFITGHTGFKGSWLSLWLSKLGAGVYGYSLPPDSSPDNYTESNVSDILSGEYISDIRDKNTLELTINEVKPDYIFHLAAQPLVRESYRCPVETFEINVIGSLNVLNSLHSLEKPCSVIMVTSDKCYENHSQVWGYREIDPMGGQDPYSASKAAAEIAISSYRESFFSPAEIDEHGIKIASVRAGNVIGGGDWAKDRIVPDAVKALSKGKPVQVRNPHAVRPWQHVLEPLSGYLLLAAEMYNKNKPELCSAWNFGPLNRDECQVSLLMDIFCEEWGESSRWEHICLNNEPGEASVLRLSIDKAVHELKWQPQWDLRETVKRTVSYYRRYYHETPDSMAEACYADIGDYMEQIR